MRIPKMWFRKQTGAWYVKIDGKQINLGKDKEKAHRRYRRLIDSGNPELYTVRQILDLHWKWLKKNRRRTTYQPREGMFRSFGESVPKNLKAASLKPYHVQKWIGDKGWSL